jgi:hypothetical protein
MRWYHHESLLVLKRFSRFNCGQVTYCTFVGLLRKKFGVKIGGKPVRQSGLGVPQSTQDEETQCSGKRYAKNALAGNNLWIPKWDFQETEADCRQNHCRKS